jgi:hypothetical protein
MSSTLTCSQVGGYFNVHHTSYTHIDFADDSIAARVLVYVVDEVLTLKHPTLIKPTHKRLCSRFCVLLG